jgi:hypothetical protein
MPELRFINPSAKNNLTYVFCVTHDPMRYGQTYTVPICLYDALLHTGDWTPVASEPEPPPVPARGKRSPKP